MQRKIQVNEYPELRKNKEHVPSHRYVDELFQAYPVGTIGTVMMFLL